MNNFTAFIYEYGLFAMFLIILLEYACFPVSSEIVLPFSGAIASLQNIPFSTILLTSILAGLIGTSICYFLGFYFGNKITLFLKLKFPKSRHGIDNSFIKFNTYGSFAVCFLRMIPLCRTYIAFIAGIARQKYISFLMGSLIGITLWNALLLSLGYYLRENWKLAISYYSEYKSILIFILFIIVSLFFLYFKQKKKRK